MLTRSSCQQRKRSVGFTAVPYWGGIFFGETAMQYIQHAYFEPSTFQFDEGLWNIKLNQYREGGGAALILQDADEPASYAIATFHSSELAIGPDEVVFKPFFVDRGLPEVLRNLGILQSSGRPFANGHQMLEAYRVHSEHPMLSS